MGKVRDALKGRMGAQQPDDRVLRPLLHHACCVLDSNLAQVVQQVRQVLLGGPVLLVSYAPPLDFLHMQAAVSRLSWPGAGPSSLASWTS